MREEYRVYYENYEELAQEEPGAEIPLQKDIVWENKNSQVNDGKHCRFLPVHRGWYWNWQSRWHQNSTLRFMRNGKRRTKTGLRIGSCHRLRKNPPTW